MKDFASLRIQTAEGNGGYLIVTETQEGKLETIHSTWEECEKRLEPFRSLLQRLSRQLQ